MRAPSAHECLAATAWASGRSTYELLWLQGPSVCPSLRRLAAVALGLRHPVYAAWPGGLGYISPT